MKITTRIRNLGYGWSNSREVTKPTVVGGVNEIDDARYDATEASGGNAPKRESLFVDGVRVRGHFGRSIRDVIDELRENGHSFVEPA